MSKAPQSRPQNYRRSKKLNKDVALREGTWRCTADASVEPFLSGLPFTPTWGRKCGRPVAFIFSGNYSWESDGFCFSHASVYEKAWKKTRFSKRRAWYPSNPLTSGSELILGRLRALHRRIETCGKCQGKGFERIGEYYEYPCHFSVGETIRCSRCYPDKIEYTDIVTEFFPEHLEDWKYGPPPKTEKKFLPFIP